MVKKTAFTATARLYQKMVTIKAFNATNVHHVVGVSWVATVENPIKYGKNIEKASKRMSSLP
ncbi:MAG: hypothetical protein EOO61_22900 [Hymenobacter sp.]|nr:MAG: hypothetical protein EOO61_22900 [Hymenobacter sp.]